MKNLAGKKILVVDDNELLREVLVDSLNMHGLEIYEAANGEEAFKIALTYFPDAIITDLQMAGGDGKSLLQKMSKLDAYRPSIFITSGFNDLTELEIKEFNIIQCFEKPFERREFSDIIFRFLNQLTEN